MAADSERQGRISSACSLKRSGGGDTQLQLLSPEGSAVYMTEVKVHEVPSHSWQGQHCDDYRHGNPITNKGTTLLGAPHKTNTPKNPSHNTHNSELDVVTNQFPELAVVEGRGSAEVVGSDSSNESSDSECDDDRVVLERAKVEGLDFDHLEVGPDGKAPLELISQFLSCLMRNEYKAAKILCEKVVQLEPLNETAAQFHPLIQERIQLDNDLSTESSSSDESTEVSDDSSDHTPSSGSSSESSSEGEGEQSGQHSDTADNGDKNQGQLKNTHKQCSHTATSWQP